MTVRRDGREEGPHRTTVAVIYRHRQIRTCHHALIRRPVGARTECAERPAPIVRGGQVTEYQTGVIRECAVSSAGGLRRGLRSGRPKGPGLSLGAIPLRCPPNQELW